MRTSLLTFALLLFTTGASMAGVLRVGTWSSPGSSPHSTLTSALAAAKPGDDIWVVKGLYQEVEYIIPFGVRLFGGFSGTETQASERNYAANVTILDGSGAHRVATVSGLLDGFTLRNGRTGDNGGGAYIKIGGQLSHCILFANEAGYDGGAIFIEPSVTNNLLVENRAGNDGAGISGTRGYSAANNTVVDNTFTRVPVISSLGVPPDLIAGGVLDVAPPAISDDGGSTVLMKGWELDGHAISMPYTVTYADNGRKLRYWAANAVGVGVSNEVAVTVSWTVTSPAQILTPQAVCEGSTLADAGIGNPAFSPSPEGGATYIYSIDGTPVSGLDYVLQYSDNGKLLTCQIKNADGTITGATTPAVRLSVMKAPGVLLTSVPALSIEEGQPLCLPTPVVLSNGSDVTDQGWKWRIGAGAENTFNSCDKAPSSMDGATLYYTATNGCSTLPTVAHYTALTVTNPVGEFLQTAVALCSGMTLGEAISFNDGGNAGDYYIGMTKLAGNSWDDVKTTVLTTGHNLLVLRFSYNGGKSERRMTLTVHAVPALTLQPVVPANPLCLGDAHTLTVAAIGDNLSYQWERSVNSTDGANGDWNGVPGATTAACRLNADVTSYYRCTVTGVCIDRSGGVGGKITSAAVQLTVNDRPVIPDVTTLNPLTICEGEEVSALLTPLKPTLSGTPATSEGWTLGGISIADDYAVVSTDNGKVLGYHAGNACGERTATFNTMKLSVDVKPLVTQDPLDVSVVEDTPVRLSISASGSSLTYQWQRKAHADADIAANWHNIDATLEPSAATAAYSFTAANITAGAFDGANVLTDYRCVVGTDNACAATTVRSSLATVTVSRSKSAVSIRRQPAAYGTCSSETAPYEPGFTVEVEGSGHFLYKWYEVGDKTTPVAMTPASGLPADAVAGKSNTFKPSVAGTYFCIITSTDDAAGAQTQAVSLTVSQAPAILGISPGAAPAICEGGSVTLGVDATGASLTYQWYQQLGAAPTPATDTKKGTAPTFTPVGLTATTKFYCVVGSGSVCTQTVTSPVITVTVQKAPKITTQPVSQSVCGSTGVTLSVTAANSDTYQWYYNGATTGANSATLANVKDGGVYTCVVSKAGGLCGEVTSVPALITVAAAPTVSLGSRTSLSACEGDLITLPSPEIETGGSVIVPEKTGWYLSSAADPATAPLVASFVGGAADVSYSYKLTYKCSEGAGSETVLTTTQGMPSLAVKMNTPVKITRQPVSYTSCSYTALSVAGTGTARTYQWYNASGTAVGTPNTSSYTPATDGSYYCVVSGDCGSATSATALVTKTPAVTITSQPKAVTICDGGVATLQVEAANAASYQWQSSAASGGAYANITGETAASLTVSPSVTTYYKCVVTGICGSVTSAAVAVTVNAPVKVTKQPVSYTSCAYSALSVAATGSSLTYQWYNASGTAVGAVNATTYTPTVDGSYYCVVSGSCGSATSATALVTKTPAVTVTSQPKAVTICDGGVATLQVEAANAASYQWQSGATSGGAYANIASETAASLTVSPSVTTYYKCVVTGICGSVTSTAVAVTVNAPVKVTKQPVSYTACAYSALSVAATGSSLTYQWYNASGSAVGTPNSTTYTPTVDGSYYCVVSGSCGNVTSATALVTKTPTVTITSQPKAVTICDGGVATLQVEAANAAGYQWQSGATSGGAYANIVGETAASLTVSPSVTTYYKCVVTGICGTATSTAAGVTVNTPVKITKQPVSETKCSDESFSALTVTASGSSPLTYQWYRNGTAVGASSSSYSPGTSAGTYHCVVSNGCGSVMSATAALTQATAPVVNLSTATVTYCKGSEVTLPTPAIESNGSVLNPALSGWSATSTGTALTSTVKAPATASGSQAYYYRISYTCGTKAAAYATSARTVTVTAQAMPVAPTFTTATGTEVCEGTSVTLPTVTNRSGQWELNGSPKGDLTAYLVHAADSGQVFRYVNTDACGQRTQSTSTYTLKVKREARISSLLPGTTTLKAGTKVTLTVPNTTGSPTTKKWILRTGTSQKLTDGEVLSSTAALTASRNVTLADDHKLLTFAAEGCLVSPDETSTTLKVWSEPTFTGDDGASDLIVSQVGQSYPFPAPPTINWNNTTPISEGWAVVGQSVYWTAVAALADNGKTICYRVGYQEPGSSVTKYVTSRTMGILRPWDVPVLSGTWSENPICAVTGGTWSLPTVPTVAANNTTVIAQEWVYKSGVYTVLNTSTVNYAQQDGKALCRKITYRIPGSTTDRVVYSPVMGVLRPYDQPVFQADQTTEKLTQVGQYYSITTPAFNKNGLTVYTEWIIGGFLSGTIAEWRHDAQPIVYKVQYKNACASALTVQNIQVGIAKVYATSRTASTTGPNRVPDDGKDYRMMDPRDNQFYTMRVDLKSKNLVMMTGLNYGNCFDYNSSDFKDQSVNGNDYKMTFTGNNNEDGTMVTYIGGCMNGETNTYKLYNFAAVVQNTGYKDITNYQEYRLQGLCPEGWYVDSWNPDKGMYNIMERETASTVALLHSFASTAKTWTVWRREVYYMSKKRDNGALKNLGVFRVWGYYSGTQEWQELYEPGTNSRGYYLGSATPLRCWKD